MTAKLIIPAKAGRLYVSDPTYKPDVWCVVSLDVEPESRWGFVKINKEIPGWGRRTVQVIATRLDYDVSDPESIESEIVGRAGVDSGMCGILNEQWETLDRDSLYDTLEHIYDEPQLPPFGAVVRSGIGDGLYPVTVYRDAGEIYRISVDFMDHPMLNEDPA